MPAAFVQSYGTSNITSSVAAGLTLAPSANVPAGTLLIIGITLSNAAPATPLTGASLVDNSTQAGTANSYRLDGSLTGITQGNVYFFSCYTTRQILTTNAWTLTVDTTSRTRTIEVLGFSGMDPGTVDRYKSNSSQTTTTTPTTGALATAPSQNEVVLAALVYYSSATVTAAPGNDGQGDTYLEPVADVQGNSRTAEMEYVIVNKTPVAYSAGWTVTTAQAYMAQLAAYRGAAAAAGVAPPFAPRPQRSVLIRR